MDSSIVGLLTAALVVFAGLFIAARYAGVCRMFGLYAVVKERTCRVYIALGKVAACSTSRACTPAAKLGFQRSSSTSWAPCYVLDLRLDQSTCAASR